MIANISIDFKDDFTTNLTLLKELWMEEASVIISDEKRNALKDKYRKAKEILAEV